MTVLSDEAKSETGGTEHHYLITDNVTQLFTSQESGRCLALLIYEQQPVIYSIVPVHTCRVSHVYIAIMAHHLLHVMY